MALLKLRSTKRRSSCNYEGFVDIFCLKNPNDTIMHFDQYYIFLKLCNIKMYNNKLLKKKGLK